MENFREQETIQVRQMFDLEEVLEFQAHNDVQIIRGPDYQYMCYINKKVYATALTPISALVLGIHLFKNKQK